MHDKAFRWFLAGVAFYVLAFVVCFGPATVESERAREKHLAECYALADPDRQAMCVVAAPRLSDGVPKALFWPLWLSYKIASE